MQTISNDKTVRNGTIQNLGEFNSQKFNNSSKQKGTAC